MIKKQTRFKDLLLWVNTFAILFILYKMYITEQDLIELWQQLNAQSDLYQKLMGWLNPNPGEPI